ncbi:BMC domain-containing protein [Thermovirga lienii]|uniref:BMC domain-containing protein n=1 Tax=Thermovirga lienii TaxID=336261 RepID=UPI003A5C8316
MVSEKARVIQEYVPGKQITLAHVIRNPRKELCEKIGIDHQGAVGILTITPGEGAIIAGDIASKSASVRVEFVDRFTGCLMISGDVSSVESSLRSIVSFFGSKLLFASTEVTFS